MIGKLVSGMVGFTLLLAGLPAAASAHGDAGHSPSGGRSLDAGERHRTADLAGVSVDRLERRMRAATRRLGRQPGTVARARTATAGNPGQVGQWGAVTPAPVVPVFEALLPNGKILMWDSVGDGPAESSDDHSFTRAAVYDPIADTSKRVDVQGANLFCAGYVQIENGNVFVAGGNLNRALDGLRQTHTFDWRTETWTRGPDMRDGRWYPSVAALPNGEALIIGGGPTEAEVRTTSGALRGLSRVNTPSSRIYPFLQTSVDGRALLLGTTPGMSLIDPAGSGSAVDAGKRDDLDRPYGSYATYDIGRSLVTGGGNLAEEGRAGVPTRTATAVDATSGRPVATAASPMAFRRRQHNLTVLADGSVLATGGQSTNLGNGQADIRYPVLAAERWDPGTGAWSTLASASVARLYHSTALLLPDGRVLTGGGGICLACAEVGYLRKDFEAYSPPYLFRKDGSGLPAPRPTLSGAPKTMTYANAFAVNSPQATEIRKLALIRLGAPTHGEDQGQRYVPLKFTASGTTISAFTPNNPNEAPAGSYMLVAVDANGVPSVAAMTTVSRTVAPRPRAKRDLARGRRASGSRSCSSKMSAKRAVNGSSGRGVNDKWCAKAKRGTPRELRVDLGGRRVVSSFVVRHAGAGGEFAGLNTRDFRIETSLDGRRWRKASAVRGNVVGVTTHVVSPRKARYIRLRITRAEQGRSPGRARIYAFEAYRGGLPATQADPVLLYSAPNTKGAAQRVQAGQYEASRGNFGQVGDDAVRSMIVAPGYRARVCRDASMRGCVTLRPGRYTKLPRGFDRAISSMRVTR